MFWELVQDRRLRRPIVIDPFCWSPPIVTIMREKDIPRRAGMLKLTAEKEQKLDAMLAAWILRKRAKRLGPKQKARLATKVGTCVDNVQYHWERYKRKHFKKVRWAILSSNDLFCEKFFFRHRVQCQLQQRKLNKSFLGKLGKTKNLLV